MINQIKGYFWDLHVRVTSGYLGIFSLMNKAPKRQIRRILTYHRVGKESLKSFEKQITYYANNYKVLPLSDFIKILDNNSQEKDNILCITFDDAYKSVYTNAVGMLDKHNIKACIFVPIDFINCIDKKNYIRKNLAIEVNDSAMTWDELKTLVGEGYTIGSHTYSHVDLGAKSVNYELELKDSKSKLENILGCKVDYFAFPFGKAKSITQQALYQAKKFGYTRVFSGIRRDIIKNGFLLPRTNINPRWDIKVVRRVLEGYFDNPAESIL